ncbi:IQ domain-containing protein IQM2-like [Magnolia sinica]|uniref:IQ domain-containing protein IQM2-like n=1 Tax=Magnolia sinica TaxID=86752 RepID=UPI002657CFA2|nr:IQ domain-containing protein IQM2-like [Magnolia sinica]
MGISFSYPFDDLDELDDFDEDFEALIRRSLSFKGEDVQTKWQSLSFNGRDSKAAVLKSFGSGKMFIERSMSYKRRELEPFHLETMISLSPSPKETALRSSTFKSRETSDVCPSPASSFLCERSPSSSVLGSSGPRHEAALKLQKVYKSFQTRRRLADCAVLVEQHWWKLLDFALLKRSSVSFFDIEKQETAVSRWSRARTRAAMVGRGLSKDKKARKLALQHWLEAIDPRHRYGHNLHFYYVSWLQCESKQPFFYWLDVGDGRDVNLEQCPRSALQHQCIKYLGPKERETYEVIVEDGIFRYKHNGQLLNTSKGTTNSKWIFVLSTLKTLYVGQKKKGMFQHSSFLAGGATSAAGRLVVEEGILKAVWPHSGHYRPTKENFQEFVNFLKEKNVDLTNVQDSPTDDDDGNGHHSELTKDPSLANLGEQITDISTDNTNTKHVPEHKHSHTTRWRPSKIAIPNNTVTFERPRPKSDGGEDQAMGDFSFQTQPGRNETTPTKGLSVPEQSYMFQKHNLYEDEEDDEEETVPPEKILLRITSRKGTKSYQLGEQLSFKWTTGVGPRIGCVRDYPSELQFRALDEVHLSPREHGSCRPSPRNFAYRSPRPSPRSNMMCTSPKPPALSLLKESKENSCISNDNSHGNQC